MTAGREVFEDYGTVGLTLRRHPVAFLRGELDRSGTLPCAGLRDIADGRLVTVAGLVLVRQQPGSAKGVIFVTLEDETGIANLVVWPDVFERQRRLVLSAGMIACHGRVQKESEVIHVVADRLHDLTRLLHSVARRDDPASSPCPMPAPTRSGAAAAPTRARAAAPNPQPRLPLSPWQPAPSPQ